MHPYISEAFAAERVRSLHDEAAARRLARAAWGHQGRMAGLATALREAPRRARAARPATESTR